MLSLSPAAMRRLSILQGVDTGPSSPQQLAPTLIEQSSPVKAAADVAREMKERGGGPRRLLTEEVTGWQTRACCSVMARKLEPMLGILSPGSDQSFACECGRIYRIEMRVTGGGGYHGQN